MRKVKMCSQPPNKIKDRHSSLEIHAFAKIAHHPIILRLIPLLLYQKRQTVEGTPKLRVVAYNVACGQWATPERIAQELKDLKPDIVLLSEVPKANRGKKSRIGLAVWPMLSTWIRRGGGNGFIRESQGSSMEDITGDYGGKFKSVLSRPPLTEGKDFLPEGSGWGQNQYLSGRD